MIGINVNPFHSSVISSDRDTTADGKQLVLVIGDSTYAGSNNNTGNGTAPAAGTAYYFRRTQGDIVSMTNDIVAAPQGTPFPVMCTKYYDNTGNKLVIIPTAVGGSNFSPRTGETDNWTTSGTCYAPAINDAHTALNLLGLDKLKYIIMALGINDARTASDIVTVEADVYGLINRLRAEFPGVPIIMEQIGRSDVATITQRIGQFRGILKTVADTYSDVYLMGGSIGLMAAGGYGADLIHQNQTGNNWRGEMMARWMINSTYSKWARSIISSHFDDLSTTRKNLIASLIDNNFTAFWNHDALFDFKTTTKNNAFLDWSLLTMPSDSGIGFSANDSISTDGSTTYLQTGYIQGRSSLRATENDGFIAAKIKTNSSAAGGTNRWAFGSTDATPSTSCSVLQTSASAILYRFNETASTTYATDTKFQDNTEYLIGRTVANKLLYKNGVQVASAAQVSAGQVQRSCYIGCNNNNGTAAGFINSSYEYFRAGKLSAFDQAAWKAAWDTFKASW